MFFGKTRTPPRTPPPAAPAQPPVPAQTPTPPPPLPPRPPPSRLVPELLEMVVLHVDDRFTLHSLLLTNRLLFEAAVPRLYADPFRYTRYSPRSCKRLFKWILTISPSTREEVETARVEMGVVQQPYQPPVASATAKKSAGGAGAGGGSSNSSGPLVDYLSYVRHIRIQFADMIDIETNRVFKKMMAPVLPWAICQDGHFDKLVTLSIVSAHADQFLDSIPSMKSLKSIYWDPTPYDKSRDMAAIRRFIEAYVDAHGDTGGRKLNMFFECNVEDREDKMNFVIPELVDTYRLLDPLPPSKNAIMTSNSWMRCLAHKETMDFGKIQKIDMIPDKELLSVLPRCHRLESLSCGIGVLSSRIFQWAAQETDNGSGDEDAAGAPRAVMPLKRFRSNVRRSIVKCTLRDLRGGFDSTLEELDLNIVKPTLSMLGVEEDDELGDVRPEYFNNARVIRFGTEINFPKLRRLVIDGTSCQCFLAIDPDSTFANMLHLETMKIEDPSSSFSDPDRLSDNASDASSIHSSATTTIEELHLVPCNAWYLPRLRELELHGASAAQFHPETLQWVPQLERLVLNMKSTYLKIPRLRSNWTERSWAWHLPSLRYLILAGPGAFLINLAALQMHMPSLEDLTLIVGNTDENTGSLAAFLKRGDRAASTGSFTTSPLAHPLRRLRFKGRWKMMALDLVALLDGGLFSDLTELWIAHMPWILTDLAIDRASHHPSLGLFWMCTRGGHLDLNQREEVIKSLMLYPLKERPKKCPAEHFVVGLDRKWYMKSYIQNRAS
ncbi:hypothetical protein BGZ73_002839 [Actinomortierella ambigua]|nr:hypothetical protein BGZ73_002839 [Actinomortierella ambigua]